MEFVRKVAGVRIYELDTPGSGQGHRWGHRRAYLYLPRHDIFLWGRPGSFHYDVVEAGKTLLQGVNPGKYMNYDFNQGEAVYGSYFTDPKGAVAHSIWEYEMWKERPEVLDRIKQVVGVPVNPNVGPEAFLEEISSDNWDLPAITSSGVDPNPPDQWWMVGCPNCEHSELDIHFHGGVSCPMCGWEGEMTQSGQLLGIMPPTEEDADALWPDYLPWNEAEQNYYRNARIAAWLPKSHVTRLAGFYVWTADIHEKAQKVRAELLTREDVAKWMQKKDEDEHRSLFDDSAVSTITLVKGFLNQIPDEGFKLFPWWVREMKKGLFDDQQWRHALDIAKQAAQWTEWSREHNKPMPDYMKKDFGFQEMQDWVYEMNSKEVVDGAGWTDSKTVHKWTDGWHMDQVGPEDLGREGELMGHCVGGYCEIVRSERSTIYSLRDPKGMPHVTIEVEGTPLDGRKGGGIQVVQVQGKGDSEPIPEYRDRVQEWYSFLEKEKGFDYVDEQDPERDPETEYVDHTDGTYNIEDLEDVMDYWKLAHDRREYNYAFGSDEEGEWEDNTIYYMNPRPLEVHKTIFELLEQMADNVGRYDEDEIIAYVQAVWLIMQHLGNSRWTGGYDYNPKGEWTQLASQFSDYVDEYYVIQAKDAPQGQERMFSAEPWMVDKLPPKVELMKDYVNQIASFENHKQFEVTQQRKVHPPDWEDQKAQARQQFNEAQGPQPPGLNPINDFASGFYTQVREMEQALPTEDYQVLRRYNFPGYDDYLQTDWRSIFGQDQWQYKPQFIQAEATWNSGDDIATKALGMLHQNYGFSLDLLGQPVEPGFYVSYQGHTRVISLNSLTGLDIENYMHDHADVLSKTPDSFFGGWIDDDGKVYLDVSQSFQLPEVAMEFGRQNHQQSIYDGFNRQTIPVDYNEKPSEWLSDGP